jgi:hypothetical protein
MKKLVVEFNWINNKLVFRKEILTNTDDFLYKQLIEDLHVKTNNYTNYEVIRKFFTNSQRISELKVEYNSSFQLQRGNETYDVPIELLETSIIWVKWVDPV